MRALLPQHASASAPQDAHSRRFSEMGTHAFATWGVLAHARYARNVQVAPGWVNPEFMRGFTFDGAAPTSLPSVGASSLGGVKAGQTDGPAKENQVRACEVAASASRSANANAASERRQEMAGCGSCEAASVTCRTASSSCRSL